MLLQRYPYLPLVPQIQQLYRRAGNSAQLALRAERKTDVMESLWDSPGWKAAVFDSGFSRERRNIALSMSTDGVNPFKKMQYSMWPILLLVRMVYQCIRCGWIALTNSALVVGRT